MKTIDKIKKYLNHKEIKNILHSWSWIFSISMGVVTITWQVPAPQPASISFNNVSFCLDGRRWGRRG